MYQKKMTQEKETTNLAEYVAKVIVQLEEEKKYPAKRTYRATLNSFMKFSGGTEVEMPIGIVFTPGRLKKYEEWLRSGERSWNTVSTYMRTLQAVYNWLYPPGSAGRNPKLFDDVYTKVESRTKRALTEEQMQVFTEAAFCVLPMKMSRKKSGECPLLTWHICAKAI